MVIETAGALAVVYLSGGAPLATLEQSIMGSKKIALYRLTPGYDAKGNTPYHWIEGVYAPPRHVVNLEDPGPLEKSWKPFGVRLAKNRELGDFFDASGDFAATPAAFAVVKNLLGDAIEGLPLQVKNGGRDLKEVVLLHSLVNVKLSKQAKFEGDEYYMTVTKFAFSQREIADKHFFVIPGTTIVSGEFRAAIESAQLTGLGFNPLPGYENPTT